MRAGTQARVEAFRRPLELSTKERAGERCPPTGTRSWGHFRTAAVSWPAKHW